MNRFLVVLFAGLFSSLAAAGVKIEHWTAPSGARVYFVETHAIPIVDVQVDFAAGTAYDPPGKSGLAGLTRGLLDAGAGSLDEEQIAGRVVDLGIRMGGSVDADRAGMTLRTLSSKPERDGALDLFRTVLVQPHFPEAAFSREKGRALAGLKEAETRPDAIAGKRFAAALYPGHPYGAVSTVGSVGAINRDDVAAFHRDRYSASRAVVSIIGDLDRKEAERIAQFLTEGLPPGQSAAELPPVAMPAAEVIRVPHPATQAQIHLGLPAIKRLDPDWYALLVGNYVLGGGGIVSRLMKEVREKRGYAYSVYSYFQPRRLEGPFEIGLQTKREQAGDALKVVQDTLAGFMAQGPTPEELHAAQRNLVDGLALRIDSNAKILGYLSAIGFYGLPLTYLDDFPKKIEAVTVKDVREAFSRHVKRENMVTVVVAGD
ncbi:MAG: insulinase family protein [Rhodocyclaceae bacterium]|nr:insulinase family protein [Rhodocyclaceae bacterium]